MKDGSCIINVARGPHLNESDLLTAIENKKIRAATLDVFEVEPLTKGHPFWKHKDILVTPHIASLIDPVAGGKAIAENILGGKASRGIAHNLVNKEIFCVHGGISQNLKSLVIWY